MRERGGRSLTHPMSQDFVLGLLNGLFLSIPIGVGLWMLLGPVDRWLDEHRRS